MNKKSLSYDLQSATPEEAEILNEKIDMFIIKQLSFHGKIEEFRNYIIKDKEDIIAGISSDFTKKTVNKMTVLTYVTRSIKTERWQST